MLLSNGWSVRLASRVTAIMNGRCLQLLLLGVLTVSSSACVTRGTRARLVPFPRPVGARLLAQLKTPTTGSQQPGNQPKASTRDATATGAQPRRASVAAHQFDRFVSGKAARRCPTEIVLIGDLCIDKWESIVVEMWPKAVEKPWSPFHSPHGSKRKLRAISKPGVVPQAYVSGKTAQAACRASGKRLCSALEWETACRGPRRTLYPYGEQRTKGKCNDDGRKGHPVAVVTSRLGLPRDRMWYEGMQHPLINQLKNTVRKTGQRKECTNEYGAYDMVGNLHEWIEQPSGTFRGGFYMDTRINGEGCSYRTTAHNFKYRDYSTGFRCCKDAEDVE